MRRLLIACATVLFASRGIAQQPSSYILSLGIGGGATIPVNNSNTSGTSTVKTGINGQAYALIQLPGFLALRFNFGYQKFDYQNVLNTPSGPKEILSGVGGLQINLLRGPVRPYITAGVGAFDIKGLTDTSTTTTANSSTMSRINFGIDAGAGLAVVLGRVSAFAEGRVQNVYTKDGGFIKSAKQINVIPVTFGLAVGLF
jgi:hypothetical protein